MRRPLPLQPDSVDLCFVLLRIIESPTRSPKRSDDSSFATRPRGSRSLGIDWPALSYTSWPPWPRRIGMVFGMRMISFRDRSRSTLVDTFPLAMDGAFLSSTSGAFEGEVEDETVSVLDRGGSAADPCMAEKSMQSVRMTCFIPMDIHGNGIKGSPSPAGPLWRLW